MDSVLKPGQYRRTAETRMQLLNAGVSLFVDPSVSSITSRLVAQKANINHALISYHFGGFSGLMDIVFEKCLRNLRKELTPIIKDFTIQSRQCAREDLSGVLRGHIMATLAILNGPHNIALLRAVSSQGALPVPDAYKRFTEAILAPIFSSFVRFVARVKKLEETAPEVAVLAQVMLSVCMSFFRGAPLVARQLEWDAFTDERRLLIKQNVADALVSLVALDS